MRAKTNNAQLFIMPAILVGISLVLFAVASNLSSKSSDSSNAPITASPNSPPTHLPAVSPEAPAIPSGLAAPVALPPSDQATTPNPQALNLLLATEIDSATPKGNGYVVKTTFGAVWLLSQQEVELLPMSMKLRIDYGKYGAGSHEN
jgi:hypothetical protein